MFAAPYPAVLQHFFAVPTALFGAGAGAVSVDALSLGCLLSHYALSAPRVPVVMQRTLLQFIALLFACLLSCWCCSCVGWWPVFAGVRPPPELSLHGLLAAAGCCSAAHGALPVASVVVFLLALPGLVEAGLRLFACLRIDDTSLPAAQFAIQPFCRVPRDRHHT